MHNQTIYLVLNNVYKGIFCGNLLNSLLFSDLSKNSHKETCQENTENY